MNLDFPVIGIVAILTGLILQFLAKPLLELWVKPEAPNHDTVIRAVALLLGVLLTFLDILIGHPLPPDGNGWLLLIGSGAVSGLASIGSYHALTQSATPANAVTVIPATALPSPADVAPVPVQQTQPTVSPTQHVVTLQLDNGQTARPTPVGTFTFPPAANADSRDNAVTLPPVGPPAPSPAPEPAATAATPA